MDPFQCIAIFWLTLFKKIIVVTYSNANFRCYFPQILEVLTPSLNSDKKSYLKSRKSHFLLGSLFTVTVKRKWSLLKRVPIETNDVCNQFIRIPFIRFVSATIQMFFIKIFFQTKLIVLQLNLTLTNIQKRFKRIQFNPKCFFRLKAIMFLGY